MAAQTRKHMMTVLPRRRRKNQARLGMNVHENIHPHPLRRDKAMLLRLVVSMGADEFEALLSESRSQLLFHVPLRGPTLLVRRKPQIAAGNEQCFIFCRLGYLIAPHCHLHLLLATHRCSATEKYTPLPRTPARLEPLKSTSPRTGLFNLLWAVQCEVTGDERVAWKIQCASTTAESGGQ